MADIVVGRDERIEKYTIQTCRRGGGEHSQHQLGPVGYAIEITATVSTEPVHQQAEVPRRITDREGVRTLGIGMHRADATAPLCTFERHTTRAAIAFFLGAQARGQAGPAVIGNDQVVTGCRRAERVDERVEGRA